MFSTLANSLQDMASGFFFSLCMALMLLIMASLFQTSRSIILCDERCRMNATDLGICMEDSTEKPSLLLMGLFPCNVPDYRGRGLTVAGQMAARAVRLNSTLLQNYKLELSFSNSMCDRVAGVRSFINQLREESTLGITRHLIIGPGCSTGAITIAETAPFYHLTQISYTATSIALSDKTRFPTFLRTISSDNASIAMISAVIREFGWRQIAIVSLRNELFNVLTSAMETTFTDMGVRVITERLSFDNPPEGEFQVYDDIMEELSRSGARVVLLNTFENSGRELLCRVHRRGLLFPEYLYISYFWWSAGWWLDVSNTTSNCTVEEIVSGSNGSIAVDYYPQPLISEEDSPTDVGSSYNEFWRDFRGNLTSLNYPMNEALRQAGYVYDAVWAAAFALDDVDKQLRNGALLGRSSLRNFSYDDSGINNLIFTSARDRSFKGVTGIVSFNEFGDRAPTGEIFQYRFTDNISNDTASSLLIAVVNNEKAALDFVNGLSKETIFPGGVIITAEELYIGITLFIIMTILSSAGIVLAVACIIFNLVFRKKRIVKLTSPYLNVIIIIGGIFFYVDVILFGIDENVASFNVVDNLCQARIWISSIGFSLFFGPVLAKAFRVYYIFRSIKLKKKPMKDWILLLIVTVMVIFDIMFLIVVTYDGWRLKLDTRLLIREGGQVPLLVDTCSSGASQYWLPILLGYKAIYLILGLMLAFQTYSVKIKKLRDSKLIVVSVFVIFVVSVVLTVIGFFVDDDPNAFYGLLGCFVLLPITGVLGLLFIPRMIELKRDPSGEVNLATVPSKTPGLNEGSSNISAEDSTTIKELRNTIASLKAEIEKAKQGKTNGSTVAGNGVDSRRNVQELLSSKDSSDNPNTESMEMAQQEREVDESTATAV